MARPRTFDEDSIRSEILTQFWAHGFDGTALPDLERVTGLSRKSLYNALGDKQAMFVSALSTFRQTTVLRHTQSLGGDGAGFDAISHLLHGLADLGATAEGQMGCMVCNTSREEIAHAPEVRQQIDGYFQSLERALLKAVQTGQAEGEIAAGRTEARARQCLGAIVSISVLAKARQPPALLKSIASETLRALK